MSYADIYVLEAAMNRRDEEAWLNAQRDQWFDTERLAQKLDGKIKARELGQVAVGTAVMVLGIMGFIWFCQTVLAKGWLAAFMPILWMLLVAAALWAVSEAAKFLSSR